MRLLGCGSLCGSLRSGTPHGLLGGEFVSLQASLRCDYLFGRLHMSRLGCSTSAFIRSRTRQCLGFGCSFGVQLVSSSHAASSELAALPLKIHQSCQDFAHNWLPVTGEAYQPDHGSLTQSRQGPKVE